MRLWGSSGRSIGTAGVDAHAAEYLRVVHFDAQPALIRKVKGPKGFPSGLCTTKRVAVTAGGTSPL